MQSIFKGVICLSFRDSFVHNYNEKAKLRSENYSKLNMFFYWSPKKLLAQLREEEIQSHQIIVRICLKRRLSINNFPYKVVTKCFSIKAALCVGGWFCNILLKNQLHVKSSADIWHHKVVGEFLLLLTTLSQVYCITSQDQLT